MSIITMKKKCCCPSVATIYKLTPCVEAGPTCSGCTQTPPKFYTLEFTGIGANTDCIPDVDIGDLFSRKIVSSGTLNPTVVCEFTGETVTGTCRWNGTFGTPSGWVNYSYSPERDCTGPKSTNTGISVTVQIVIFFEVPFDSVRLAYFYDTDGLTRVEIFKSDSVVPSNACVTTYSASNGTDQDPLFYSGGSCLATPGDIFGSSRCPGGAAIFTDTNLSANVGGVVELNDGVCYQVSEDTEDNVSDGGVTVVQSCNNCPNCCDDNC